MSDTIDRKRQVDVDKLNEEQLQQLIDKLGSKVRGMVDETCERANKLLNVYGLQVKMEVVIQQKDSAN